MRKIIFFAISIVSGILMFFSCNKNVDNEKPIIDLSFDGVFPYMCDTLYFGDTFNLKILLKDNMELGAYSVSIHHNFDHHSHSTEVQECNLDPQKTPINPLIFIKDFYISEGKQEFYTNDQINLPLSNSTGNFDEGDYHFFIQVTDKEGWSTQKGLSIKILRHR